jgi:hypothetical protein
MPSKFLSANNTVEAFIAFQTRYEKLRAIFLVFCESCIWLAEKDSPIRGFKHKPHLEDNQFFLIFCGRTFRFQFDVAQSWSKGRISTYELGFGTKEETNLIGTLIYVGTAESDMRDDDGDNIFINDRAAACLVALRLIQPAFAN